MNFSPFLKKVPDRHAHRIIWHIILLAVSLTIAFIIFDLPQITNLINYGPAMGFVGAFLGGALFTSALSAPIGTALLVLIGRNHDILPTALAGSLGSLLGDYLIFHFLGKTVTADIEVFAKPIRESLKIEKILENRTLYLPAVIVAGLIIASPLPDELGLTLLSAIKVKTKHFLVVSLGLNFLGIVSVLWFAHTYLH